MQAREQEIEEVKKGITDLAQLTKGVGIHPAARALAATHVAVPAPGVARPANAARVVLGPAEEAVAPLRHPTKTPEREVVMNDAPEVEEDEDEIEEFSDMEGMQREGCRTASTHP
jgi:hypothetical protein